MVAESRMFFARRHASRSVGASSGAWLLDELAQGTLGALVLKMAEDLAAVGAAIDLALAEDEIDRMDDASVDALLAELGLIPRSGSHRSNTAGSDWADDAEEPTP